MLPKSNSQHPNCEFFRISPAKSTFSNDCCPKICPCQKLFVPLHPQRCWQQPFAWQSHARVSAQIREGGIADIFKAFTKRLFLTNWNLRDFNFCNSRTSSGRCPWCDYTQARTLYVCIHVYHSVGFCIAYSVAWVFSGPQLADK